ncbi:MAG: Hsp33 family molecular chaperone HslO [Oscillospiraceae bacterium]|jgi:molecular chaperone Hsp33|nr:Hsp33 family molecular chaperone HslO [Oscillospiraceae bacterium]
MKSNEQDKLIRAISGDGYVSLTAVTTCAIAARICEIHAPSRTAAAALGRLASAASIMGEALKSEGASVTCVIDGKGPVGQLIAVADSAGNVRVSAKNPVADLPLAPNGKLNVGGLVGTDGFLSVVRDFGIGEPYTGYVPLVSGEIAEDFAAYFVQSEQVGSAVGLGVLIGGDDSVLASGGFLLSLLPGCPEPEKLAQRLEENIKNAGSVTEMLCSGGTDALVDRLLAGMSPRVLDTRDIFYKCTCSRERTLNMLASLPESDRAELKSGGETLEITCDFCDEVYLISPGEL